METKGTCRLILVGKGCITIFLDNEEDRNKIWSGGPWVIGKQLLRFSPWSPFFDPEKQRNTHALVWVKFPGLGVEFWEVDTLMAIGRTLGMAIQVDQSSTTMEFDYFAKVLVDADLAEPTPNKILVEVEGGDFWQKVVLGATPNFVAIVKQKEKNLNLNEGDILEYPRLGNLWCLWKSGFNAPVLVAASSQHLTISYDGLLLSAIHGLASISTRRALWTDMESIANLNLPWLAIGDFNCIRSWDERSGGFSHNINDIKRRSLVVIKDAAGLSCNSMANNYLELSIVAALGVPIKARPLPRIQSTTWALPWFQEVKINCGVAAIGSTGKAGVGVAARNHLGDVLGILTKGLGNTTLFFSECEAILGAIDWAAQNNWKKIWIESDSQTAISDFTKNHVPWPQRARWNRMKSSFEQIRFSHCWKVANFSAYQAAKRGVSLSVGNLETFQGRPHFLTKIEEPNV
ncbi:hypothetical protein GIB67_038156 [Kingdonia uniflora]|uniref:RNase H type-1 domain-containing protein n=1 Tax=Kingdonia uniflora TaxID=39325 RepID=A0A7J7M5E8_9MAGN|nr:hypothetical protein GIB67_038156 [Kingdonia uniflora]